MTASTILLIIFTKLSCTKSQSCLIFPSGSRVLHLMVTENWLRKNCLFLDFNDRFLENSCPPCKLHHTQFSDFGCHNSGYLLVSLPDSKTGCHRDIFIFHFLSLFFLVFLWSFLFYEKKSTLTFEFSVIWIRRVHLEPRTDVGNFGFREFLSR